MFGLGVTEIAVVCGVALLLFGPKQLPKLARSIGQTIGELKRAGNEITEVPKQLEQIVKEGENHA
jgi:TatA/E family protein of Tat protein translocase